MPVPVMSVSDGLRGARFRETRGRYAEIFRWMGTVASHPQESQSQKRWVDGEVPESSHLHNVKQRILERIGGDFVPGFPWESNLVSNLVILMTLGIVRV